ncbi:MAG: endopeptidase La [Mycoplasmataceae bacterium]|nr:endopeptidase La [Mycoplasmataceae bacterium]
MNKPILLTRGIIVFPTTTVDVEVGRERSVASIEAAWKDDKKLLVVSQIDPQLENPKFEEVFHIGTLCEITNYEKTPDDNSLKITVKGLKRVSVKDFSTSGVLTAEYETLKETGIANKENGEKIRLLYSLIERTSTNLSAKEAKTLKSLLLGTPSPSKIADKVAAVLPVDLSTKQNILAETNVTKRIDDILRLSTSDNDKAEIDREISKKVNETLSKQQKEFYLREKMRAVKEELGILNPKESETNNLRKRLDEGMYPEHIRKRVIAELAKIDGSNNPQENSIIRTYVEWLLDLPWWQTTKDNAHIQDVEATLNKTHYGLDKVKERIVEYLAVKSRSPNSKAPIICLVGPPGVGKSTLARSIAEALGKKFVKMSLGGVRDEAEIRGHRKTYIGSMPGRIIKAMKQAEVINPLFLLDELDKMTSDMRGDPASALLEVLDPEQNNKFSDNYIEENYDLSKVMFVATANYLEQIPEPLHDRLEIIELTSYTEREKLEIAKKYLITKICTEAAISSEELKFEDEGILKIIRNYTREAGVRELERLIQKIARKFIVRQQHGEIKTQIITVDNVHEYLKKEIYDFNVKESSNISGVVNGMAYTNAGGDLLPIEVTWFKGKGNIAITGNLKETMKESAGVALGYVKANAEKYGIKNIDFNKIDIHIHVPSGGIPKDGPSAGVTLTTAIISALSNRPVPNTIAMTGEITLRGRVLIIGGVKEKVISAFRGGVNEIFIPKKDERYLEDVPKEVSDQIKFHFVEHYADIYQRIFKVN